MYKFEKIVLDNGLRLIVSPTDHNEIALRLFIKGGSQYERKEESGISHFIEHMLLRGTRRWPAYELVEEKMERISQDNNGVHTDFEQTSYFFRVQPRYFIEALDLLSDLVWAPLIKPEDIEKEKQAVPEEIKKYLDIPEQYVQDELWQEVCFGDHPAGRPICGTEETVRDFSEIRIRKFFEKTYVGSRMVLAVAGDLKKDAVFEKVGRFFSEIKAGVPDNSTPVKLQQKNPKSLVFYKDTQQTHLAAGFKSPFRPGSMESYAAKVLADILRRNIYLLLVGKKGNIYSVCTEYWQDPTKSFIRSYAGTRHDRAEETILDILSEYKKMARGDIEAIDMDKSVRSIIRGMRDSFSMDPLDLAEFFGLQELFTGEMLTPREEFKIYQSLKVKYLQDLARLIFVPANLNLALIGPHTNEEKFQKLLDRF